MEDPVEVVPSGVDAEVVEHMGDGLSKPLPKYDPPPPWWFTAILCIFPALLGFVGGLFVVEMGWLQPDRYKAEVEHLKFEADLAKTNATFYQDLSETYKSLVDTHTKINRAGQVGTEALSIQVVACEKLLYSCKDELGKCGGHKPR
jgi:hypothetical protein